MKLRMKTLTTLCMVGALSGCQQVYSIMYAFNRCDQPEVQLKLEQVIHKDIANISATQLKSIIENDQVIIDGQLLQRSLKPVQFKIENIDKIKKLRSSDQTMCTARIIAELPSNYLTDADVSRALNRESNVLESAALSQLNFENNQISTELNYSVRISEHEVTVQLVNALHFTSFMQKVLIDAHLKPSRLTALALDRQKKQALLNNQNKTSDDYQSILIAEAQLKLDQANEDLNSVWSRASLQARQKIQYEQELWAKKRNLECKLNSEGADNPEVFRLNCETNMAISRTSELQQKIFTLS
ncbi:lysozyme inhibitor LprI family protein [Acinetobacter sp. YH12239]|uniref:lysozyme inhibitor LprI family protein n=1 Tax=Acinetobacter sp. YH12239 TaxID=2601166 RepID=UPI0015D23A21|nr:lysozyme inhibitor LprI family protein [Acinetobacter sp. YH12239]